MLLKNLFCGLRGVGRLHPQTHFGSLRGSTKPAMSQPSEPQEALTLIAGHVQGERTLQEGTQGKSAQRCLWFLPAQESYHHRQLVTKQNIPDLFDSGKNVIPGLSKGEVVASLQPGLGVFNGMDKPRQMLATRMWNSNRGFGEGQRIFVWDP